MINMKKKSFTLLEMMVVMAIIFIITAIAMPNFWGGYKSKEVKGSARRVASILSTAKSYAQAQNTQYDIVFWYSDSYLNMDTYKEFDPTDESSWDRKVGKSEKFNLTKVGINTSIVKPDPTDPDCYAWISFYPDGRADDHDSLSPEDEYIMFTLDVDGTPKTLTIYINENTGCIQVSDLE